MRFCLWPRCGTRISKGAYCALHGHEQEKATRGNSNDRGYNWQWRTRALAFLAMYPLCGMRPGGAAPVMSQCHAEQRVTAAVQVDHVEPHRGDQALFWNEENWQSLCRECGARKSAAGL